MNIIEEHPLVSTALYFLNNTLLPADRLSAVRPADRGESDAALDESDDL
jgi:hypothetical protein